MSKPIAGREFAKALEAAGIVSDLNTIKRIVIDVRPDRVDIHVQRMGTERLLGLAPLLEPLAAEGVEKVVRYWVLVADELLGEPSPWAEVGLRLAEYGPWKEPGVRWCLFEDPDAPPELDGKKVELTVSRGRVAEDGPDYLPHITERRVIG